MNTKVIFHNNYEFNRRYLFYLIVLLVIPFIAISCGQSPSVPADKRIRASLITGENILWAASRSGALRFDGEIWTSYLPDDGLANKWVTDIAQGSDGSIWFSTRGGVSQFDGSKWIKFTKQDGIADDNVGTIATGQDGTVWIGTYADGNGVSFYNGNEWISYNTSDGLANNWVNDILIDQDQSVWFATRGGVSHFKNGNWITYTVREGLISNNVNATAADQRGIIWFGTNDGLSAYNGENWTNFNMDDVLLPEEDFIKLNANTSCNHILSLAVTNEYFWAGTSDCGVLFWDGYSWTIFSKAKGLPNNLVTDIYLAQDNIAWISTPGGLAKIEGQNITTYK